MGQQQSKFSRRSLLATLPAASVAVAAPAALGRAVDDASLDEAIAACRSAAKSAADFDRSVLAPARTA